jgi:hypothetical protein
MTIVRTPDFATVRERSPFWGLALVLGEIAERLLRRQADERALSKNNHA